MTGVPLIFGEVLFDCFPDGREVLGGAPFNVAWNLQALGMNPFFVSRVGNDAQGEKIVQYMKNWLMTTRFVQIDPTYPTGKVLIKLQNGEPRFEILADQAYDQISADLPVISEQVAFLYHGSLALRNQVNRNTLAQLKEQHSCPVFIDVNLRNPWWSKEQILSLLKDAAWLKLNEDELTTIFPGQNDTEECCTMILDRFKLKALFVTRGSQGALAVTFDNEWYSIAPPDSIEIVDTVGAGDAFSSVLLIGLANNWPLDIIIQRAQDFASGIVSIRGATTQDRNFYNSYCKKWDLP